MTINLDPAQAGAASGRLDRQHANARQESWMAHLQDALFGTQAPNALLPQRARPEGDTPAGADPQPREHARRDPDDGPAGAHAAAAAMAAPAPQRAPGAGAAAPATTVSAAPGAAGPASPGAHGQAATVAEPATATEPAGPVLAQASAAAGMQAPSLAVAAAVLQPGAALAAQAAVEVEPPVAAAPLRPAAAQPGAVGAEPGGPSEAAAPLDDSEVPAAGATPFEAEEYAQRHLHLYQDGGGVQAWVRDATLTPAQVAAVARALAGQFAASGQPLTALTVNGRKAAVPPGARDAFDHAAAQPVAVPSSKG